MLQVLTLVEKQVTRVTEDDINMTCFQAKKICIVAELLLDGEEDFM